MPVACQCTDALFDAAQRKQSLPTDCQNSLLFDLATVKLHPAFHKATQGSTWSEHPLLLTVGSGSRSASCSRACYALPCLERWQRPLAACINWPSLSALAEKAVEFTPGLPPHLAVLAFACHQLQSVTQSHRGAGMFGIWPRHVTWHLESSCRCLQQRHQRQ